MSTLLVLCFLESKRAIKTGFSESENVGGE